MPPTAQGARKGAVVLTTYNYLNADRHPAR
jgi:hypothetical protein